MNERIHDESLSRLANKSLCCFFFSFFFFLILSYIGFILRSLNTHVSSPFTKRNYISSTYLFHEKTFGGKGGDEDEEINERRRKRRGRELRRAKGYGRRERRRGSREREESGKMHFFCRWCTCARINCVSSRYLTSKNSFLPNGNKIFQVYMCVCVCVYVCLCVCYILFE